MTFDQVPWLALCAGLTTLGVVLTWTVGRGRGAAAVLRGLAWSLLPIAAFLTGTVEVLWRMGVALTNWVAGFVFDIQSWIGVAIAGLAFLLFMISGVMRARGAGRAPSGSSRAQPAATGSGATTSRLPAATGQDRKQVPPRQQQPAAPADDDFSDIEEILRRRGIS